MNGSITHLTGVPRVNLTLANDGFETKSIFKFLSAEGVTPKEMDVTGLLGLKVTLRGPSNALASQVNAEFKRLKVNDSRAFEGTLVGRTLLRFSLGGKAPLTRSLRGNVATFFKDNQERIVVPLKITGPVKRPSVSLDRRKVIKKGVGQLFERFFKWR